MVLRLILNVKTYKRVTRISFKSGFKVLLDDGRDIQNMLHHGFEIGAGSSILAAMNYKETVLSEAPFGTCGTQSLKYLPNDAYTYSGCTQNCWIKKSWVTCCCVEGHRRGKGNMKAMVLLLIQVSNDVGQNECTAEDYLGCIIK
ncbi:hypothetical protein CAPTEDRAFT_210114, partial [Capitella teleta]